MKLLICSDIHADFHYRGIAFLTKEECDVILIAGDLGTPETLYDTLAELGELKKPVVYVLGNHDYVDWPRDEVDAECARVEAQYPHVQRMENSMVTIGHRRFLGGTLWYAAKPDKGFFDFRRIPGLKNWYREANKATLDYILENAGPDDIVVTHHLPSWKSVHPKWQNADNSFFVCPEAEPVIEATQPMLWIHGHTHDVCDYMYGATRVLCNPLGYPHENKGWRPLVIDV